jgi:hypothetical protein
MVRRVEGMDRRALLATGGAAALAAALPSVAQADNADQGLVGSYIGRVTATDAPLPPFTELISFLAGGVVVESRRYAVQPGPPFGTLLETTGHGAWKRTGNQRFEVFFRFLLQDLASTGEVGSDNVTLVLALDGDSLTGTFASVIRDPADNPVESFSGTYTATRIAV